MRCQQVCIALCIFLTPLCGADDSTPEVKLPRQTEKAFVPVSIDWPFTYSDRRLFYSPELEELFINMENPGSDVERIIKMVQEEYKAEVKIEFMHGIPIMLPVDEGLYIDSNLSPPITLKLTNVSFIEALSKINQQINCDLLFGSNHTAGIRTSTDEEYPDEFYEKKVNIDVENVSARKVLSEILSQMSIWCRFAYQNGGSRETNRMYSYLYIDIYGEGKMDFRGKRRTEEEVEKAVQLHQVLNKKCDD